VAVKLTEMPGLAHNAAGFSLQYAVPHAVLPGKKAISKMAALPAVIHLLYLPLYQQKFLNHLKKKSLQNPSPGGCIY
jgi:hypothetical protein